MSLGHGLGLPMLRGGPFSPKVLFAGGVLGGWYDPSDLATLWQDSARTTPVTTYGQPVGAIDDKSGNGRHLLQATAAARPTYAAIPSAFGADLVTNGAFAADTDWAKGAGWTIAAGVASASASSLSISQAIALTAGKLYRITFTITAFTSGTVRAQFTGGTATTSPTRGATGTFVEYLRAEAGNTTLALTAAAATLSVDNVSCVEVTAYTGSPGLFFDGSDDAMAESGTHTITLPTYVAVAFRKRVEDTLAFFGTILDASNLAAAVNFSPTGRVSGALRSTARGNVTATCGVSQFPVDTDAYVDTLSIAGTTDAQVNNNTLVSTANTWIGGDTVAASKLRLSNASGTAPTPGWFYGGAVVVASNPGAANRAAFKRWLGAKAGLAL